MESKSVFWAVVMAIALGPLGLISYFPAMGKFLVSTLLLNILIVAISGLAGFSTCFQLSLSFFFFYGIASYPFSIVYALIAGCCGWWGKY